MPPRNPYSYLVYLNPVSVIIRVLEKYTGLFQTRGLCIHGNSGTRNCWTWVGEALCTFSPVAPTYAGAAPCCCDRPFPPPSLLPTHTPQCAAPIRGAAFSRSHPLPGGLPRRKVRHVPHVALTRGAWKQAGFGFLYAFPDKKALQANGGIAFGSGAKYWL